MQQPRGGEQQRPYGPDAPLFMIWPKGGQTDTGLDPWGRTRTTLSTEYCAGVNTCCTNPPCVGEEPYRTHLRDDDSGVRPQDQCACIYHEDQKHPTEYRKPAIICAGLVNSDIGVGSIGSSLLPQDARRENWTYDTRRNWTGHEVKSYQSAATPPWDMRQRGDYQRSMTYSSSDQPMQETISKYGDPYTRTFKVFHDRRGNLLDDGRQVFEYDALNRLTGVWESAKGGGQINPETGLPYNELELGTKGHPIAAFTYDGYGHRLTARYNVNDNAVLDDDPVDVYAYDRLWRVRTVTRATPSGSGAEATWTWYVREKWYYHDTESGQEMMTGPNSTDAPIMRLIDRNGDGDFGDAGEEQHFVNDHQGSTVLVTGKATLDPTNGNLIARAPIIAHVKYDQYGVPKFVHPADVNSDGVVDAADDTFWKQAWNEYVNGASGQTPPKEIWKGVADADENGLVDISADPNNANLPSATNSDWVAFHALHVQGMAQGNGYLAEQLGNLPLYAGYWWDDAIGLYHVRHRVYRPEWGRWLQRDSLGYAPGWNLYQYVNGMPWGSVDPMGLWSVKEIFYTLMYYPIKTIEQIVEIGDALIHPIRTVKAIGQHAVQVEDNAARIQGRTATRVDYAISVLGELVGANQASGGIFGAGGTDMTASVFVALSPALRGQCVLGLC
jgi:RHS repeat-associated protein